jgi:hypothetical protein
MTWNYRIIKHYSPESDETYYVLAEVFMIHQVSRWLMQKTILFLVMTTKKL